jgi:hypothetical protein
MGTFASRLVTTDGIALQKSGELSANRFSTGFSRIVDPFTYGMALWCSPGSFLRVLYPLN